MDEISPIVMGENPKSKSGKKFFFKSYPAAIFVLIFAITGGYIIINGFASTVSLTKVWNTDASWSTGTLDGVTVQNNTVQLATNNAASQISSSTVAVANPTNPTTKAVATPVAANLALNRPVKASSTESGSSNVAGNAVDGKADTRWSSVYSDPQAIYVDLGSVYNINEVKLNWETAYGKAYKIQVSNDAKTWTTIYSTNSGTSGVNDLKNLNGVGRYVRMYGTQRGTQWGYSLWEMEVYGTPFTTTTTTGYSLNVLQPIGSQSISGLATFSGTQSNLKNVEVWYNGANVGTATLGNGTWTAVVDTSKQTNGNQTYTVYGWDVAAGQQAKNTVTKTVAVSVNNSSSTPSASGYNLAVSKPTSGQSISGLATFSGTQSNLKNVEVWYNGANVGTATLGNGTWTAVVDTSKQTNGNQTYTVYGWDVAAGQQAKNTVTKDVAVNVSNSAGGTPATYSTSGSITLGYDAGSSVSWTSLTPQIDLPSGTSANYKARSSNDNTNWSAWSSDIASLPGGRYIQVQANLATTNPASTPVLHSLTLAYSSTVASPTITITATPTTVTTGQAVSLTWNSANATSCTASGAWSGSKTVSGTTTIAPTQAGTATYSLACSGTGGTANASANVTVTAASTGGTGGSSTGGCTNGGVVAPCIGGPTTGANGWGTPVFDDEFNGTGLDKTKWSDTWFGGGNQNGVDTAAKNVSVSGGNLLLMLSTDGLGSSVNTNPNDGGKTGYQFGNGYYIEGSVYYPGNGQEIYNWPAFWTNGQSWPMTGEADISEGLGTLTSNYHWGPCSNCDQPNNSNTIPGTWSNAFHTYGLDRENGTNYIYWDGKLIRSYSTSDNGSPQYIIINVGGSGHPGAASQVKVDYVRIWKK